jgi:hypothetical protein
MCSAERIDPDRDPAIGCRIQQDGVDVLDNNAIVERAFNCRSISGARFKAVSFARLIPRAIETSRYSGPSLAPDRHALFKKGVVIHCFHSLAASCGSYLSQVSHSPAGWPR